jgi:hypothetical protein
MQLDLRHRALQPEQEPVVVPIRIIDTITVAQQRPRQRTQLDQLVPVLPGPGQPRHVQPQHQADMPHRELGDQPGKPGPRRRVGRRPPQILVDHQHPRGRPPQRRRPFHQPVLQPRRLAVVEHLLAGGLTDIHHRKTITMPTLDLLLVTFTQRHHAHRRSRRVPTPEQPPPAPAACSRSSQRPAGSSPATTPTVPPPGPASTCLSAQSVRVCTVHDAPSSRSRARSRSTSLASRSRPSLPIIGVLTPTCPRILACDKPTDGVWGNLKTVDPGQPSQHRPRRRATCGGTRDESHPPPTRPAMELPHPMWVVPALESGYSMKILNRPATKVQRRPILGGLISEYAQAA